MRPYRDKSAICLNHTAAIPSLEERIRRYPGGIVKSCAQRGSALGRATAGDGICHALDQADHFHINYAAYFIETTAMRPNLTQSDHARHKLILAAIKLFAEHGVDSVSLRLINREAGYKNNSALHYHFGSKLCLIEGVDEFIQRHFDEIREPQLEALELRARNHAITLREALEVFVNPYVAIIERYDWGYAAVRTIARMEFDGNEDVHRLLSNSAGRSIKRFSKLKRALLPGLSARQFKQRHNFVVTSTIHGFADYRNLHLSYLGDVSPKNLSELSKFYIDMGVAAFTAPS